MIQAHHMLKAALVLLTVICIQSGLSAQDVTDKLKDGFKTPPVSAMPRTWWHWTNSNITKEGITKDLEWMKRVGIAGMQLADVASGGGQTVSNKIVFGSPEWLDAVKFAASEGDRLGLEMAIFSSAGWSLTGGPWVKPEQAMKKLVWSETIVTGGKTFTDKLPQPPSNIGPIRNLGSRTSTPGFYGDCAVIAYRTPSNEADMVESHPVTTSNSGIIDATSLLDDDLNTALTLTAKGKQGPVWVQFTFDKPFTARAITIAGRAGIPFGRVMASTDGNNFQTLTELPGKQGYRGGTVRTFSFPEISARIYRVEFTNIPLKPADVISQATTTVDTTFQISELKLYSGARVNRWEDKAGFNFMFEYESVSTPQVAASDAIKTNDIINLTSKMSSDGTLNWDVPAGKWTVMRFGYSLTGSKNRPAVPSGLGYEVDKLSKKHTEAYLHGYTDPLVKSLGALYGKSLQYVMMDSWEAGIQNWTDEMLTEFQKRRGYDPTPFLPVLAGRVVQSAAISDRFLWDFRRTLVDMFAENHYGVVTEFLHKQGIKTYGEVGGVSLESIEDALLNKKYVDIPMGEFWVKDLHPSSMYYEDVRGAASAAHIYGKNVVAAESFTGGNYESPYTLKKISDYWFTQGINRLVFHTSAHQPLDTKPGNTMVGTHINRNITWAEKAAPFMAYLARNSYMLQKGLYVADIAYLLNEGAPSTMPFWGAGLQPATPEGYQFDYFNADALVTRMSADANGNIVLPDGMSYRVLVLPNIDEMTLPVLLKIKELVKSGVTVVGPKPVKAPGLTNFPGSDLEIHELAAEIWGDLDGVSRTKRSYGKGKIFWGMPLKNVMSALGIVPDVEYSKPLDSDLSWIHRRDGDTDIYFFVNRSDMPQNIDIRLRITGKEAELWHSDNGLSEPAAFSIQNNTTTVPLHLNERETVFVVFSKKTSEISRTVPVHSPTLLALIDGPWQVSFPPKMGAPATVQLNQLESWTMNSDEGVKYFSGTATYSKSFEIKKSQLISGQKIYLDLGKVADIAEVTLNGKKLDISWKAPYRLEITQAIQAGKNQLEINVTNEWTNRLIGDRAAGPDKKILDAYTAPFGGAYQLTTSGLIGPVKIESVKIENIK